MVLDILHVFLLQFVLTKFFLDHVKSAYIFCITESDREERAKLITLLSFEVKKHGIPQNKVENMQKLNS